MKLKTHKQTRLAGVTLLATVLACGGQEGSLLDAKREIHKLTSQLEKIQKQYGLLSHQIVATKSREQELEKNLNELQLRFAAMGDNLLQERQDALLEAVKNAEVLRKRNFEIEMASSELINTIRQFLKTTLATDPEQRDKLETSIRELDLVLKLRQKPPSHFARGNLQHAEVISIDTQSGLLVINAGEDQDVRRGMTFSIRRGNRKLAQGIVAETRRDFSGILPTEIHKPTQAIRTGDIASLIIQRP